MKRLVRWIQQVYRGGLRLYPVRFREAFGREMEEIFQMRSDETMQRGWRRLVFLCLQEFWGLLMGLMREHWANKELTMKNVFSKHNRGISGWGALGFGVAFALVKGIAYVWHVNHLFLYILGGLIGGVIFSFGSEAADGTIKGQRGLFALLGGVAFGGGRLVTALLLQQAIGEGVLDHSPVALISILEPALIGALIGAGIGFIEQDWKVGGRLAVASALGFGLGQITGLIVSLPVWGLVQAIDSYQPHFNGQISPWVGTVGTLLVAVVVYVVAGMVGGATLGKTIEKLETR